MAYKLKTNKSASKRFKVTGSGRVKFGHAKGRHGLTQQAKKLKRQRRAGGFMQKGDARTAKELLGLVS